MAARKRIIPEKCQREYEGELSELFHTRINLFCYIAILTFVIQMVLGLTALPGIMTLKDMPGIIIGLSFALFLLIAEKSPRSLARHKTRAFLFSFVLIWVAIMAARVHPEAMSSMGITLILLAFFTSVLLLPWTWYEAVAIGLFALINFVIVYREQEIFRNSGFFEVNIVLLYLSIVIAAIVERSEELLRQKQFAAQEDIKEKNAVMARELELAKKIHKSLMPRSIHNDLVDIAVTYKPMLYMGGDYAKFHFMKDKKVLFIVADVTGHGVSSALLVNRVHTEVEELVRKNVTPGELLKALDDFINKDFAKIGFFLTAFCGMLDFEKKQLTYTNYGHPPQLLLQSKENSIMLMKSQTFLMGISMDAGDVYHNETSFESGDRLILFTDGIIEAKNLDNELFGYQRLETFAAQNKGLDVEAFHNKLVREVEAFQAGLQCDDIFLVTVQIK